MNAGYFGIYTQKYVDIILIINVAISRFVYQVQILIRHVHSQTEMHLHACVHSE